MLKIGIIGDRESIQGFSTLGIDMFTAESAMEVEGILNNRALMGDYAVMYITEAAAKNSMIAVKSYRSERTPAVILIPGKDGSLGLGMQDVRKSVEKAVGADILFKDE